MSAICRNKGRVRIVLSDIHRILQKLMYIMYAQLDKCFGKIVSCLQVLALWLADSNGPEPVVQRLAALQQMSHFIQNADPAQQSVLDTCSLNSSWSQWCDRERNRLRDALVAHSAARVKALREKNLEVMSAATAIPASCEEGPFRTAVGAKMKDLSSSSTLLKKRADELQTFLDVLLVESSDEAQGTATALQKQVAQSRAVSQCIAATLVFFAALTLFRSSALGGKSEQSKKAATDLNNLIASCLSELESARPCMWLDEASMEELLLQMSDAVPSPAIIAMAGHCQASKSNSLVAVAM